jgi:GT2 family glycosyltransferase
VFDTHRFDPEVEGRSPRLEDLDFSYRVGRIWKLLAEPRAQLIHRTSRANRRNVADFAAEAVPRRYWFVEKNIRHPLRKPAFWWAMLGRMLALLASPNPEKEEVLRGHLRGLRDVWRRHHPLSRTSS